MPKMVKVALDMQMDESYVDKLKIPTVEIMHASNKVEGDTPNGGLIKLLSEAGIDVLLTCDTNMFHQQNRETLPLSVITIFTHNNKVKTLENYVAELSSLLRSSLENRFYCAGIKNEKRTKQERILLKECGALYPKDSTYHNKTKISQFER